MGERRTIEDGRALRAPTRVLSYTAAVYNTRRAHTQVRPYKCILSSSFVGAAFMAARGRIISAPTGKAGLCVGPFP